MTPNISRRTILGATGATSLGLLAGCVGPDLGLPSRSKKEKIDAYLSETDNYGGTIQDATGNDSVKIGVGVQGNGRHFAFGPPAVRVSSGTTVTWVLAEGKGHDVVHLEDEFESGPLRKSEPEFEYTFTSSGLYLYHCGLHDRFDMKGAIVVE
jgi:halocyanin-like protein